MQLTAWLLVEVALLLIGLTHISLTKSGLTTRLKLNHLSGCGLRLASRYLCSLSAFSRLCRHGYSLPVSADRRRGIVPKLDDSKQIRNSYGLTAPKKLNMLLVGTRIRMY